MWHEILRGGGGGEVILRNGDFCIWLIFCLFVCFLRFKQGNIKKTGNITFSTFKFQCLTSFAYVATTQILRNFALTSTILESDSVYLPKSDWRDNTHKVCTTTKAELN